MPKPDVDSIEGLSPAIGVQAGELRYGPRSTVGTVTEIHDLLRLLFARVGEQTARAAGTRVEALTVPQMVDRVLSRTGGRALQRARAVSCATSKATWLRSSSGCAPGLRARGRSTARWSSWREVRALRPGRAHTIDVDVDRLSVKPDARSRLAESLELGLRTGRGVVRIAFEAGES